MLDRDAFQQLLAAAYILQTESDRLPPADIRFDFRLMPSARLDQAASRPKTSDDSKPAASCELPDSAIWRMLRSDQLFWKAATVFGAGAVAALLLGASINSLAPLPAGISLPLDAAQQQIPFRRPQHQSNDHGVQRNRPSRDNRSVTLPEDSTGRFNMQ